MKTGYLVGFRDRTGLRIGRRKRKRPTVGGRGETGKDAGVENRIFRDLSGLKIGRRKRRRTTVRRKRRSWERGRCGKLDIPRPIRVKDREEEEEEDYCERKRSARSRGSRDRRRDASDDDENSDDDHLP